MDQSGDRAGRRTRAQPGPDRLHRGLDAFRHDVLFGVRMLARNPGFAAAAILTLALATGATTAIFSVVDHVLLRPLPFADPGTLVQVYGRDWREEAPDGAPDPMTGPVDSETIEAIRESRSIVGLAGYTRAGRNLRTGAGSERVGVVMADRELFDVLGARPLAGRTFRPDDPADVAVIGAALWRRRFGASPAVPGTTIELDGRASIIIGVMPDAFQFPYRSASVLPGALPESRTDVWLPLEPLRAAPAAPLRRGRVSVIARLAPGVPQQSAAADLDAITRRIETERYAGTLVRIAIRIAPLAAEVTAPVRRSLWLLFAAVGLVLATACANVANLMLARMTDRTREILTRAALGAGRFRIVRQLIAESLVLSVAGGLLGVFVARLGVAAVVAFGEGRIPRVHEIGLDWRAFGFMMLACVGAALFFGLAPAVAAARVDIQTGLREAGAGITMGGRHGSLRSALVITEVAVAFVLGAGAIVLVREVIRLLDVDTGMTMQNAVTLHLSPSPSPGVLYAIADRVSSVPGVEAAGFIQLLPLQNWGWEGDLSIQGRPADRRMSAELRYVSPGYFDALGIPLLKGRGFSARDDAAAPRVILVNDALVRAYIPDEEPVGLELDRGTIIGVVGDVTQADLDRPASPEVYYPAAQNIASLSDIGFTLVARTSGRPEPLIPGIRSALRLVDPDLTVFNVRSMHEVRADSMRELLLYRALILAFATLAIILAAIGLYAVMAITVTARSREFAIRLALGSDRRRLAGLVLRSALRLCGAGLIVGATVALPAHRLIAVSGAAAGAHADAVTYGVTATLLVTLALFAAARPLLRAARTDPATSLRHD